jgi:hypothetical protein
MKRDDYIDFHLVEDKQLGIHARLLNWAQWADGKPGATTSPMFRLYIAPARGRSGDGVTFGVPVDRKDAVLIAKAVAALPESHRAAVNWAYIKPVAPIRAARTIGTSLQGLAMLLRDGRQMLINRSA